MKTMFKVEYRTTNDMEGRSFDYNKKSDYIATLEEAKAYAIANHQTKFPYNGDYRIVAITMDEATFTYTTEVVYEYSYEMAVRRWERAEADIAFYTKKIADLEASKVRVRTEKGMEKKNNEIAQYRAKIEKIKTIRATWKK
jgi:hypothetical protein